MRRGGGVEARVEVHERGGREEGSSKSLNLLQLLRLEPSERHG